MFKISIQATPIALLNIFQVNSDIHSHNTRHQNDFRIQKYRNNIATRSFLTTGPKLWHEIPQIIKQNNYRVFSKKTKIYLTSNGG